MRSVLIGAWLALGACGGGPVAQGARQFESGDLDGAIATWDGALDEGYGSGQLHYDLGNAWYRKGDLGRAIGHWRIAELLRPRDPSIAHNLGFARADVQGAPAPVGLPAPWLRVATVTELTVAGTVLLAVGSLGLWLAWWRRWTHAPWLAVWALGALLGTGAWAGARAIDQNPTAVVVASEAPARDMAAADAAVQFSVRAGAEVSVERSLGPFVLVATSTGRRGWVASSALLVVHPASRGLPGYPP